MPGPRQQDHRLDKDELVTYRYSKVLVEVQSGVALQSTQHFTNFCDNRINVVFPRKILINENAQIFYINFRLKTNIFILFVIKHAKFWLISKSLLVRMKYYKVRFFLY